MSPECVLVSLHVCVILLWPVLMLYGKTGTSLITFLLKSHCLHLPWKMKHQFGFFNLCEVQRSQVQLRCVLDVYLRGFGWELAWFWLWVLVCRVLVYVLWHLLLCNFISFFLCFVCFALV